MCVVSMIMDHYDDEWRRKYVPQPWPGIPPYSPNSPTNPWKPEDGKKVVPMTPSEKYVPMVPYGYPSQEEIDEFRRLLERAREYDKKNNEPDCEIEEKKQKLKDLAKLLGVEIDFV